MPPGEEEKEKILLTPAGFSPTLYIPEYFGLVTLSEPHIMTITCMIQWNLRTRDTLGLIFLSLVERLSLSQRVPYRRFNCSV